MILNALTYCNQPRTRVEGQPSLHIASSADMRIASAVLLVNSCIFVYVEVLSSEDSLSIYQLTITSPSMTIAHRLCDMVDVVHQI